ncbi:MAG: hypothetical protein ACREMG_01165, partial [Gemmatimonadales bacterium]
MSAQDSIDAVLGQLRPGQVVRVTTAGQGRVAARILELETGPRLLRLEGIPSPVALGSIDSLWVRGRATKTGLIVGAAVGGVSAFALAAAICGVASEGQGCDVWGTVAAIGLGGAAGGALLGAAVGSAIPKWRWRYARGRPPVGIGVTLNRGVGLSVS